MRTRLPALRTLPSRTWLTFSWRATWGTSTALAFSVNAVLRETTNSAETLERSVMMSSLIPSLKYSCWGSSLMLAKGRTQIDSRRAGGDDAISARPFTTPVVRASRLPTTLRQPGASRSPLQPARSAHWIWSKGMGNSALSTVSWTSLRSARARSASERTHSDFAASADQTTTTALAARSRSWITSA